MILTRSWLRAQLFPTFAISGILLALVWSTQALRLLDFIVNKGLPVGTFLWLTLLLTPSLLLVILPFGLLLGSLQALRRGIQTSEIISWQSCEAPPWLIARAMLYGAGIVTIICYIFSLWLSPLSMTAFKDAQHHVRESGAALLIEPGTFTPITNDLTIFVAERAGPTELRGLMVDDRRDAKRPTTWLAQNAELTLDESGQPFLLLQGGQQQQIIDGQINVIQFTEHTLNLAWDNSSEHARWRDSEERLLLELTSTEGLTDLQAEQFSAEMQRRLLWPLLCWPLTLLALAAMLPLRRPRTQRWFATMNVGFGGFGLIVLFLVLHNIDRGGDPWATELQWLTLFGISFVMFLLFHQRQGRIG